LWLVAVAAQGSAGAAVVLVVLELQQDFLFYQGLDVQSQSGLVGLVGHLIAQAEAILFSAA
jgi:hypothetical protein